MKIINSLLLLSIPFALFADEPSAYGAGNLESPNPYGLTPEERVLLETKKELKHVKIETKTQDSKVNSLRERIDGLQSIVEGLAQKNHKLQLQLRKLSKNIQEDETNVDKYEKRLEAIAVQNSTDISHLKNALSDINATLFDLNKKVSEDYVSKKELEKVIADFNAFKKLVASEFKRLSKDSDASLSKLSKAKILKEAERAYAKKHYTKAIKYYKYLLAHNYKPARSSFKLGEIYYYKRDYATALAYYKESAKRYSKAKWMPTLMLHTAFSMKYTGDKANAKRFFEALIKKYPSSKAAKIAKKHL
ncbi:TPR repeat containing exported protein; Putative periplasmic protein contains a protein prenylyltransferase domain [hydrothermal vent metagenome]|uniref:TPR repeat containing exported protein Putative periplasmic protein contains a protein prenylyltransferase domain n=1 Tax=hydrothermal vent metagenome TaxID=652676 RepID=A0A1W1BT56_9ZZZZ